MTARRPFCPKGAPNIPSYRWPLRAPGPFGPAHLGRGPFFGRGPLWAVTPAVCKEARCSECTDKRWETWAWRWQNQTWVIETTDGWVDYEFQTENRQGKGTSIECFGKAIWVISIFPSARKGSRRNSNSATFRQTKCSLYSSYRELHRESSWF